MGRTRVDDLCAAALVGSPSCQPHGIGDLKLFEPETVRAAPSGRWSLAADGCASTSSDPACCFCAVWGPGEPRGVAVANVRTHWFGHAHPPNRVPLLRILMRWTACSLAIYATPP